MSNNSIIISNTLNLFTRHFINVIVALISVRISLDILGIEKYGIFTVITAIVMVLSFLPNSLASATQRYFAVAISKKDNLELEKIYSTNVVIFISFGILSVLLLQTIGILWIKGYLSIPKEYSSEALILFTLMSLNFYFTILKTTYIALLIAFEDIKAFSRIAIFENVLRLSGIVFVFKSGRESMIDIGLVYLVTSLIIYLSYFIYFKRFYNIRFNRTSLSLESFKSIATFTFWTITGQLTTMFRSSGLTILVNQFFTPIVVSSRGISSKISSNATQLPILVNTSFYSQIIQSYASNNYKRFETLVHNGSKFGFYLMWLIVLPLLLFTEEILLLWLKEIPKYTIEFTRLSLLESLIFTISLPLTTAARAEGKVRNYEITLGTIQVLIFVFSWIIFIKGYSVLAMYYIIIVANILMLPIRLHFVSRSTSLKSVKFYSKVVLPLFLLSFFLYFTLLAVKDFITSSLGKQNLLYFLPLFFIFNLIVLTSVGLNKEQKKIIKLKSNDFFKGFKNTG